MEIKKEHTRYRKNGRTNKTNRYRQTGRTKERRAEITHTHAAQQNDNYITNKQQKESTKGQITEKRERTRETQNE